MSRLLILHFDDSFRQDLGAQRSGLNHNGETVRPQDGLHLVGERRDVLAGDEEGGRVEEVDENLIIGIG